MSFQPSEALAARLLAERVGAVLDMGSKYSVETGYARALAAIADALTIERLTAAAAEGPWNVDSPEGESVDGWTAVSPDGRNYLEGLTEHEAIMVAGALNLAARREATP